MVPSQAQWWLTINYLYLSFDHHFSLPVLQSTFSSSWLCWFIMATCTRDILSHIGAALPHHETPQPSAPSGFGCQTTQYAKPVCMRCCHLMRTCSFMREFEGLASAHAQRSDQNLAAWLTCAFPVILLHLVWRQWLCYHLLALCQGVQREKKAIPEIRFALWITASCSSMMCCGHFPAALIIAGGF